MKEYYRTHGIMSEPGAYRDMLSPLPQSIPEIIDLVQNFLLHQHCAPMYDFKIPQGRLRETWMRSFGEKLEFLSEKEMKNLHDPIPLEHKMIAICRDFSVIATALCREAGIPARARCGFADYLEPGKYIDHWILEYWNSDKEAWIRVDTQLDDVQKRVFGIQFDSLDVGKRFLTASEAWILCRNGDADPSLFGIMEWWGFDYICCNLLLDANSLLKMPFQPWDLWPGYKVSSAADWIDDDFKVLDELAEVSKKVDDNFKAFRSFMDSRSDIRIPDDLSLVINSIENPIPKDSI